MCVSVRLSDGNAGLTARDIAEPRVLVRVESCNVSTTTTTTTARFRVIQGSFSREKKNGTRAV